MTSILLKSAILLTGTSNTTENTGYYVGIAIAAVIVVLISKKFKKKK